MADIVWSADALPAADRFDFWREAMLAPIGITAEPDETPPDFGARVLLRNSGPLQHIRVAADNHRVLRRPREIARRQRHAYSIYREVGARTWFEYAGFEFTTRPGDVFVTDADTPWQMRATGRFDLERLLVPKHFLEPHLPAYGRAMALRLTGRPGAEALAIEYLDALLRQWSALDAAALESAAGALCRVLAVAAGAAAGEHREAAGAARLAAAKRHIERHLSDPALSASGTAAALGISARSLHLLFEPTGLSFGRYVQQRRLAECRAALSGPAGRRRAVSDIAFAWGFDSLPSFYRAFRREFGLTPGEVRGGGIAD